MKDLYILKSKDFSVVTTETINRYPKVFNPALWDWIEGVQDIQKDYTLSLICHLGKFYIILSKEFTNPETSDWETKQAGFPQVENIGKFIYEQLIEFGLSVKDRLQVGEVYIGKNTGEDKKHEIIFLYSILTNELTIQTEFFFLPEFTEDKLKVATQLRVAMEKALTSA